MAGEAQEGSCEEALSRAGASRDLSLGPMRFRAFYVTVANADGAAQSVSLGRSFGCRLLGTTRTFFSSREQTTCCIARVEGFDSRSAKHSFPLNSPLRSNTWEEGAACSLLHVGVLSQISLAMRLQRIRLEGGGDCVSLKKKLRNQIP